jgi:hypothetical protein
MNDRQQLGAIVLSILLIAAGGFTALSAAKGATDGANDDDSNNSGSDVFSDPVTISLAGLTIEVGPPMDNDSDGVYEDLNGDGELTVLDAVLHAVVVTVVEEGELDLTSEQADAVDVDRDGDVGYDDASALARMALMADDSGDEEEADDSEETTTEEPAEEPSDDEPAGATVLALGETASDTVGPDDEADWYAVDLEAGQTVTVTGTDEASDTTLTAYEPTDDPETVEASDLTEIDSQGLTITEETLVEFTADESGTYYFGVTDDENDGDEPVDAYEFTVTATDDGDEPAEETTQEETTDVVLVTETPEETTDTPEETTETTTTTESSSSDLPPQSGGSDDPYDCDDFDSEQQAQDYYENNNPDEDPSGLDADNDGDACEETEY